MANSMNRLLDSRRRLRRSGLTRHIVLSSILVLADLVVEWLCLHPWEVQKMTAFRSTARWLLAVLMGIASGTSASAQLVEYNFTGTYQSGDQAVGNEVTGSVVLDLGTPGVPGPGAPNETLFFGGTTINVVLNSGISGGSETGGEAAFGVVHYNAGPNQLGRIQGVNWETTATAVTSNMVRRITLAGASLVETQVEVVPDPWDLMGEEQFSLNVLVDVPNSSADISARYTITSFTKKPTTVIIGGIDTGINDIVYQGRPLSVWLTQLEATSPNSAVFFARVFVLASQLRRDGLITATQRNRLLATTLLYLIRR